MHVVMTPLPVNGWQADWPAAVRRPAPAASSHRLARRIKTRRFEASKLNEAICNARMPRAKAVGSLNLATLITPRARP